MKPVFKFFTFALLAFATVLIPACVDLNFDEPPLEGEDPGLTANTTIAQLKSRLTVSGSFVAIEDDVIIRGVVVADDRSGNFFQSIMLQDETAGIDVRISISNAYNFFPIGRELYIKCKGLVLGDNSGNIQLGGYTYTQNGSVRLGNIVNTAAFIFRSKKVGEPAPRVRTINELNASDISTLVRLENVEFAPVDTAEFYADAAGLRTLNRTVQDCNGNTITLRTSGFATFAVDLTPKGKGSLTAIYTVFGATKQLFIRELSDVQMEGTRCAGGSGPGGDIITIASLRALHGSGASSGPAGKSIEGVVISDRTTASIDTRNMVIQDETGGIVVRFTANHNFSLGEKVEVAVGGVELSEFQGLLQLNNATAGSAASKGPGVLPTPRSATVAEVNANVNAWESTLVKISNATLSGGTGGAFSGNVTVNDGTGTVVLFTRGAATFSGQNYPTGNVSVTAIVSQFTNPQIIIRAPSDVEGGGGGGTTAMTLAEVRALYSGATTNVPANRQVRGVVISDRINNNWTTRNLVLQDGTAGIVVRLTADHTFNLGDSLVINVGGMELSVFNGLLQLNNVPNANATRPGAGVLPTPRTATIAEIIANYNAWESTLVRIANATFTDTGTYNGSKTVTDGTGSIALFTRSQAPFSGANVPTAAVSITGVVSQFSNPAFTPQLIIRNLSDVN
jgi:DNA/RNA endonuclease YhcR with UshA esterase domain